MNRNISNLYQIFKSNGFELYMVGGCVRDFIIKSPIKDIDLVTDASPEEIISILKNYRLDLTGKHFAVVRVFFDNGQKEGYEIASYRKDLTSGRNPIVDYKNVTIEEDSSRRDLTINALYMNPISKEIKDFTNGLLHLKNDPIIIDTPGNPIDRFNEDSLRILRTIRFKNRYAAIYSNQVKYALEQIKDLNNHINGEMEILSQERIIEEFIKAYKECANIKNYISDLLYFDFLKDIIKYDKFSTEINFYNIITIFSSLFINYEEDLEYHLNKTVKLPSTYCKQIILLKSLNFLNDNNAILFKQRIIECRLDNETILNYYDTKIHRKLCEFNLTVTGKSLIQEGYSSGPKIGIEINKREKINFIDFLNK